MSFLTKIASNLLFERPARSKTYTDYAAILVSTNNTIQQRANNASDSDKNRRRLSHIIGIERWGQSRLRVALGDPFIEEEYQPRHRPAKETSWADLKTQFAETRAATIALAHELSAENVPTDATVYHNTFGELTARGWLHYLQFHAANEAKGLK